MRKIISFLAIFAFLLACTSCARSENTPKTDSDNNYEKTEISIFQDLWRVSNLPCSLSSGEIWDTDAFTLTVTNDADNITFVFSSNHYTISECFEDGAIYMYAISCGAETQKELLDNDLFYMTALLGDVDDYTASATMGIPSDAEYIMALIIIDGIIYNAMYFLD